MGAANRRHASLSKSSLVSRSEGNLSDIGRGGNTLVKKDGSTLSASEGNLSGIGKRRNTFRKKDNKTLSMSERNLTSIGSGNTLFVEKDGAVRSTSEGNLSCIGKGKNPLVEREDASLSRSEGNLTDIGKGRSTFFKKYGIYLSTSDGNLTSIIRRRNPFVKEDHMTISTSDENLTGIGSRGNTLLKKDRVTMSAGTESSTNVIKGTAAIDEIVQKDIIVDENNKKVTDAVKAKKTHPPKARLSMMYVKGKPMDMQMKTEDTLETMYDGLLLDIISDAELNSLNRPDIDQSLDSKCSSIIKKEDENCVKNERLVITDDFALWPESTVNIEPSAITDNKVVDPIKSAKKLSFSSQEDEFIDTKSFGRTDQVAERNDSVVKYSPTIKERKWVVKEFTLTLDNKITLLEMTRRGKKLPDIIEEDELTVEEPCSRDKDPTPNIKNDLEKFSFSFQNNKNMATEQRLAIDREVNVTDEDFRKLSVIAEEDEMIAKEPTTVVVNEENIREFAVVMDEDEIAGKEKEFQTSDQPIVLPEKEDIILEQSILDLVEGTDLNNKDGMNRTAAEKTHPSLTHLFMSYEDDNNIYVERFLNGKPMGIQIKGDEFESVLDTFDMLRKAELELKMRTNIEHTRDSKMASYNIDAEGDHCAEKEQFISTNDISDQLKTVVTTETVSAINDKVVDSEANPVACQSVITNGDITNKEVSLSMNSKFILAGKNSAKLSRIAESNENIDNEQAFTTSGYHLDIGGNQLPTPESITTFENQAVTISESRNIRLNKPVLNDSFANSTDEIDLDAELESRFRADIDPPDEYSVSALVHNKEDDKSFDMKCFAVKNEPIVRPQTVLNKEANATIENELLSTQDDIGKCSSVVQEDKTIIKEPTPSADNQVVVKEESLNDSLVVINEEPRETLFSDDKSKTRSIDKVISTNDDLSSMNSEYEPVLPSKHCIITSQVKSSPRDIDSDAYTNQDEESEFYKQIIAINDLDSIYQKYIKNSNRKSLNAELAANLFVRLGVKFCKYINEEHHNMRSRYFQCATIVYNVIETNQYITFTNVASYLLSFIGVIKLENTVPIGASASNILPLIGEMVERNILKPSHVAMFTYCISQPNLKLTECLDLRVQFLHTCFLHELNQLNVYTQEDLYLITCFRKISDYFVHLNTKLANNLLKKHLLPFLTERNSSVFVMNVLKFMGLIKDKKTRFVSSDITTSVISLNVILSRVPVSFMTTQELYAFMQLKDPRFQFCQMERDTLLATLETALNKRGKYTYNPSFHSMS